MPGKRRQEQQIMPNETYKGQNWAFIRNMIFILLPNKIKQVLTQQDAVFLVLLLENDCKYFMALQVGVNDFSVLRTMKNTLGM